MRKNWHRNVKKYLQRRMYNFAQFSFRCKYFFAQTAWINTPLAHIPCLRNLLSSYLHKRSLPRESLAKVVM